MNATSTLALVVFERNLNGLSIQPKLISIEFIGPESENNVKNNIANADAIIRFGK